METLALLEKEAHIKGGALENKKFDQLLERFSKSTEEIIRKGQEFTDELTQSLVVAKEIKSEFRSRLLRWRFTNPFMRRCIEKPRGFPGDYLTLEMMYGYTPQFGEGLAGFFDYYLLSHSTAVRSRLEKMEGILVEVASSAKRFGKSLKVLSLGSGPCREWFDLDRKGIKRKRRLSAVQLVCFDRDEKALEFGLARLRKTSLSVTPFLLNRSLFNFPTIELKHLGPFDLIYALGIADYFYDASLGKIFSNALQLLGQDGTLILTHKDKDRFNLSPSDWLCDWRFVMRGERDFVSLVEIELASSKIARYKMTIERDSKGLIIFCIIRRIG